MVRVSRVMVGFFEVLALSFICSVPGRAQQTQPEVVLPRLEIGANVSATRRADSVGTDRSWTGLGCSLTVNGNISDRFALAGQAETCVGHATTVLGGVQVSTGFYYGNNRDPVPGRFFARALVGAVAGHTTDTRTAAQVGGGADVLLSRTHGVGVRWEVGYEFAPSDEGHRSGGRVAIGLIFGPHLPKRK